MTSGDTRKVSPGDVVSAKKWNRVVDDLPGVDLGSAAEIAKMSRSMVRVWNTTGSNLEVGVVMGVQTYKGPNADATSIFDVPPNILLEIEEPTAEYAQSQLVLLAEPIPDDEIGWAVVQGFAIARISDKQDDTTPAEIHAAIALDSADYKIAKTVKDGGFAKIVEYISDGTNNLYALVKIPVPEDSIVFATVDSEDPAASQKYKATAIAAISGTKPTAELLVDLSDDAKYGDYVQPMIPKTGFSHTKRDELVLKMSTDGQWQRLNASGWIAKWARGTFTVPANSVGETDVTVTVSKFWDGYNPGATVPASIDVPSALYCDEVLAMDGTLSFDPAARKYVVITTGSALVGTPRQVQQGVGEMTPIRVGQGNPDACDEGLCYEQEMQTTMAFGCEPPADEEQKTRSKVFCLKPEDLCCFISTCCDTFATEGDTECEPCEGTCNWLYTAGAWTLDSDDCDATNDCGCSTTPTTTGSEVEGDTISLPCNQPPPPPPPDCGTCTYRFDLLGGWIQISNDCTEDCFCGDPGADGIENQEIIVDCERPDPPPECCVECGGDEVQITGYSHSAPMQFDIDQNGDSFSSGACRWTVPVHIIIYEADDPHDIDNEYDDTITITHDDQNLWDVISPTLTLPNTIPPGGTFPQETSWHSTQPCDENPVDCFSGVPPSECPDIGDAGFAYTRVACVEAVGAALVAAHPELFQATGCSSCDDVVKMLNAWSLTKIEAHMATIVMLLRRLATKFSIVVSDVELEEYVEDAIATVIGETPT